CLLLSGRPCLRSGPATSYRKTVLRDDEECGNRFQTALRTAVTAAESPNSKLNAPNRPRIPPTSKPNFRCKRLKKWGGSPGVTRTPDQRFRKPLLYPSELRGHGDVTPLSHVTLRARLLRNERLRFWSDAVSTRGLARNPPALLIVPVHGLASLGDGLRKLVHARPEQAVPRAAKNSPPSSPSESKERT